MHRSRKNRHLVLGMWLAAAVTAASAAAVSPHLHEAGTLPHEIPRLCRDASVWSIGSGAWSDPATWSSERPPGRGDHVRVSAGTVVSYDELSARPLHCVEIEGTLAFRSDRSTRMVVGTLMVLEGGALEIGTPATPIAAEATAEVLFVARPPDVEIDPLQYAIGLIGLGRISLHGAPREPTFSRLSQEPLAGQASLALEAAPLGWRPGDRLVVPDTRQLRERERGDRYDPQWEEVEVARVDRNQVTLARPLRFDHRGARGVDGRLDFLPHAGNVTRNVILRSADPTSARGHVLFSARADVDVRHARFEDLGRTAMGGLDSTELDAAGRIVHRGVNQIGRYALHLHHLRRPEADGVSYRLVGNALLGSGKWGITIHDSHGGVVQGNVVYRTRGVGIVTEDGTERANVIAENLVVRVEAPAGLAELSEYSGGLEERDTIAAGFWFAGGANRIRNNVAASAGTLGFALAVNGPPGAAMEFDGNEAYGAVQDGIVFRSDGRLRNPRTWHAWRHGLSVEARREAEVEAVEVRGDPAALTDEGERSTGVWLGSASARVVIRDAHIMGVRIGLLRPFFHEYASRGGPAGVLVDNGVFHAPIGIAAGTRYVAGGADDEKLVIRGTRFPHPAAIGEEPAQAISMNYGMQAGDRQARAPVYVYDYNRVRGDSFRVYYSRGLASSELPCAQTRLEIDGSICPDGVADRRHGGMTAALVGLVLLLGATLVRGRVSSSKKGRLS